MTGFILPELIIESIIRDGLANLKANPKVIESVFAQLTRAYANRKYGLAEITKIKALIADPSKEIAILFSYHEVDSKPYSYSIMVGTDSENKARTHLDDHFEGIEEQITDPIELEALHRVDNINVTGYDPLTGKVSVVDATDLSPVYRNMIYVDAAGTEFTILTGINNTPGDKSFFIQKQAEVDFVTPTAYIRSSLDYKAYEVRGTTSAVNLIVGVHSKDALTTKYLYILLKYFLLSRKKDLIKRGIYTVTYDGSDFNRDSQFTGDQVFSRFLTISGKIDDIWRSDEVILIDNIEINGVPVE
jgi:hypothetical protein